MRPNDPSSSQRGFRDEKLLCGSLDGTLICIDSVGRMVAALIIDSGIHALSCSKDGRAVFGACADGSIRVWSMEGAGGRFTEVHRFPKAHAGAVTALTCHQNLLVSGGNDGCIRVWRIVFV